MKKVLFSIIGLTALAGCGSYYDYYEGSVRYTQDGSDCIYYSDEYSRDYSENVAGFEFGKKIVYRDTRCEDLYARDMMGTGARNERRVLTPAANASNVATANIVPVSTCNTCGYRPACSSCGQVAARKYVVVPAM